MLDRFKKIDHTVQKTEEVHLKSKRPGRWETAWEALMCGISRASRNLPASNCGVLRIALAMRDMLGAIRLITARLSGFCSND